MKIRNKYILTYFLTIFCPILLFLGVILSLVSHVVVQQSIENEAQVNEQLKHNLSYALKNYTDIVNRLCYSGELQDLLGKDDEELQRDLSSYLEQKEIIRDSILFYDYQVVPAVYLLKPSPLIDQAFFLRLEEESAQRDMYGRLTAEGSRMNWECANGKIVLSRPLMSYQMEPYGLVQLVVREQDIYRQLSAYDAAERYIVIWDEEGKVVSSNDRTIVGMDYTGQEAYLRRKDGGFLYTEDGENAILYEGLGEGTDEPLWTISTRMPVQEMKNLSVTVLRTGLLTAGACFLAASLLYLLLSGDIARRIRKLSLYMEMQGEDTFVRIPEQGPKDEIYKVQKAFNQMIGDIEQLIHDNYVSELKIKNILIEKQSAELFALQNQMHPHFLFNTLESIRMKLQNGDNPGAQKMLVSLSKILRMSLADQGDLVPLKIELEYVEHYIRIQRLRFPERYGFQLELEDEMKGVCVPKYAVQTLVENAVLHGIDPKGGKGHIRIHGERRGTDLYLSVTDDGVGMPEEKLRHLQMLLGHSREKEDREGIGIRNVNERLVLHFGTSYTMSISSQSGEGTEVVFHVPYDHCG